jgi:hypothetical protein
VTRSLAFNVLQNAMPLYRNDFSREEEAPRLDFSTEAGVLHFSEMFLWNYRLVRDWAGLVGYGWVLPVSHGFCKTADFVLKEGCLAIVLLARRSRHQAGTRYLRRGINGQGFVANEVEVEQIVLNRARDHEASSYVQVRGSVPVFWFQRPNILVPKPPIEFYNDDIYYQATQKHFRDLVARYGSPVFCINLMKQKEPVPREILLSEAYENALNYTNKKRASEQVAIHYEQFDMKHRQKECKELFVREIRERAGCILE